MPPSVVRTSLLIAIAIGNLLSPAVGRATPPTCDPHLVSHVGGADLAVTAAAWPDRGGHMVVAGDGHDVMVMHLVDGQSPVELGRRRMDGPVTQVAKSPDSAAACVVTDRRRVHLLRITELGEAQIIWSIAVRWPGTIGFSGSRLLIAGDLTPATPPPRVADNALTIIDATAHADQPVVIGRLPIAWPLAMTVSPTDPDLVYASDLGDLLTISIHNPASPIEISRLPRADTDQVITLAAEGNRLAAGRSAWTSARTFIDVLDVSTPVQPAYVSSAATGWFSSILIIDGALWYTNQLGSIGGFDIRPNGTPLLITTFSPGDAATCLARAGDRLITATVEQGLWVHDAARARHPEFPAPLPLLSHKQTLGTPREIAVNGSAAIAALGAGGTGFVSFADPNAPRIISLVDTPGFADDVAALGSLALVADGTGGVRLFDVSNPAAPAPASPPSLDIGDATAVEVRPGTSLVYIIDASIDAIRVFDFIAPTSPRELGVFTFEDAVHQAVAGLEDLCFDGDYLYTLSRGRVVGTRLTSDLTGEWRRYEYVHVPTGAPRGRITAAGHSAYAVYPSTGLGVHFDPNGGYNRYEPALGTDVAARHNLSYFLRGGSPALASTSTLSVSRFDGHFTDELGQLELGTSPYAADIGGICLDGSRLFLGDAGRGLCLIDLPGNPRVVTEPANAHLCPFDAVPLTASGAADPGHAIHMHWRVESHNGTNAFYQQNEVPADFIGPRQFDCVLSAGCMAVATRQAVMTTEAISSLILDGGFEEPSEDGWNRYWSGTRVGLADGVQPRSGNKCLLLGELGAAATFEHASYTDRPVPGVNTTGPLTLWARSLTDAPAWLSVSVPLDDYWVELQVQVTSQWTEYQLPITRYHELSEIWMSGWPFDRIVVDDVSLLVPMLVGDQVRPVEHRSCPGHPKRLHAVVSELPGHPVSYQWSDGQFLLVDGPDFSGTQTPMLTIHSLNHLTDGHYRLIATISCGDSETFWSSSYAVVIEPTLFEFLDHYFRGHRDADHNRNGSVTVEDLFGFLGDYLNGCN